MKLNTILKPEYIKVDCRSDNTEDLLSEMVQELKNQGLIARNRDIVQKLIEREKLGSTSIGNNSAVPHTKIRELGSPVVYIGISKKGIFYSENDTEPVHLIILILSPNETPIIHLQILAAAAALIKKSRNLIKSIQNVTSPEQVLDIIRKCEAEDD